MTGSITLSWKLPDCPATVIAVSLPITCAATMVTAVEGFTVNEDRLQEALERNPILVTALNPVIGYEKGAAIAKKAYHEGRPIREVAAEETDLDEETLKSLLGPGGLTQGGIKG